MKAYGIGYPHAPLPDSIKQDYVVYTKKTVPILFEWTNKHPEPDTKDWYWWRSSPKGIIKVLLVYKFKIKETNQWAFIHPDGDFDMGRILKKWPDCQWGTSPIPQPTEPTKESAKNLDGANP